MLPCSLTHERAHEKYNDDMLPCYLTHERAHEKYDDDMLPCSLKHERVHIKYKDDMWKSSWKVQIRQVNLALLDIFTPWWQYKTVLLIIA